MEVIENDEGDYIGNLEPSEADLGQEAYQALDADEVDQSAGEAARYFPVSSKATASKREWWFETYRGQRKTEYQPNVSPEEFDQAISDGLPSDVIEAIKSIQTNCTKQPSKPVFADSDAKSAEALCWRHFETMFYS